MKHFLALILCLGVVGCGPGFKTSSGSDNTQQNISGTTSEISNLKIYFQGTGATVTPSVPVSVLPHHSGDVVTVAVVGDVPANGGPSLQLQVNGGDAVGAQSIELFNEDTGEHVASGGCISDLNSACVLIPTGQVFETKTCAGGTKATGPVPGKYQVIIAYAGGVSKVSTIVVPTPCSVFEFPVSNAPSSETGFNSLSIIFQGTGALLVKTMPVTINRHHSGDTPIFAVNGTNPANGGPSLSISIAGSDANEANSMKLSKAGTTVATGACNPTGNKGGPVCQIIFDGTTFFETKNCIFSNVTAPKPGSYEVAVGYTNGKTKTSTLNFGDQCSVFTSAQYKAKGDRMIASTNPSQSLWLAAIVAGLLLLISAVFVRRLRN